MSMIGRTYLERGKLVKEIAHANHHQTVSLSRRRPGNGCAGVEGEAMTDIDLKELREWAAGVMGYTFICSPDCDKCPLPHVRDKEGNEFSFNPLTDLNQAFMVVEKMRELGLYLRGLMYSPYTEKWTAMFTDADTDTEYGTAVDSLRTLAILLAAKATGVKGKP